MEPEMLALMGRTISIMENLGFLWVVQTGLELELWEELENGKTLEELLDMHPSWDKILLEHWLEQAFILNLLTKNKNIYKTGKLGKSVQKYRDLGLEAMYKEFVVHWAQGFARLPGLITNQNKRIPFESEMEEELISKASLASEPFVWPFLRAKCKKEKWQRVLDIGCGEGAYLYKLAETFPELRGVGVEINSAVCDRAQEKLENFGGRIEVMHGDILNLSEDIGQFDVCLLNNSIYYFTRAEKLQLLTKLKQYLKPGGQLGILTALRESDSQSQMFHTHIPRNLMSFFLAFHEGFEGLPQEKEIKELFEQAGYINTVTSPLAFRISHFFFAKR